MAEYDWDPIVMRFRDPVTGRYVSRQTVRAEVDALIVASQNRIRDLSNEMRQGKITLAAWEEGMIEELKLAHLGSEALLRGGWKQMTQADFGRVGQRLRVQYEYLANFVQELLDGTAITDGLFMSRAGLYAGSARVGFHEGMGLALAQLGYREERNILHPAEHCWQCVEETDKGWVPINSLLPIGDRACLGNDKCDIRYR